MTTEAELLEYVQKQALQHTTVEGLNDYIQALDYIIEHHGVKGQKWGVRKRRNKFRSSVSNGPHISELSDHELRAAVSRMQLEKQYRDLLNANNRGIGNSGKKIIGDILRDVGKQHARKVIAEGVAAVATGAFIASKMGG